MNLGIYVSQSFKLVQCTGQRWVLERTKPERLGNRFNKQDEKLIPVDLFAFPRRPILPTLHSAFQSLFGEDYWLKGRCVKPSSVNGMAIPCNTNILKLFPYVSCNPCLLEAFNSSKDNSLASCITPKTLTTVNPVFH